VRDVYRVGDDALMLVATDRISAFDVVLNQGIPDKGHVLTRLSAFWFEKTAHIIPNHLISADDDTIMARLAEEGVSVSGELRAMLAGRTMLCRRTTPLAIEAVVRGYLSGSGWSAYREFARIDDDTVDLWGVSVPSGLHESGRLPEPIFTPSTKAAVGHDQAMRRDEIASYVGEWAGPVERAALDLYSWARGYAAERGIILADTKFEFGTIAGRHGTPQLLLIDEALTPDSSRFWDAATYAPGGAQPSFDKQFVRDFLLSVPGWDKRPPAPDLPPDVVEKTAAKYRDAYRRLTGCELS
jgi:phosphoribosylaminoimidazole-succinocarboxamide synthase